MGIVAKTMSKDFICVSPHDSILEVARQISNSRAGAVSVCEDGKFKGIITESDVIDHIAATGTDPALEHASSLLNNRVTCVPPSLETMEAAKIMAKNRVRVLPVIYKGKLSGILTLDDLAHESLAIAAMVLVKTARNRIKSTVGDN